MRGGRKKKMKIDRAESQNGGLILKNMNELEIGETPRDKKKKQGGVGRAFLYERYRKMKRETASSRKRSKRRRMLFKRVSQ